MVIFMTKRRLKIFRSHLSRRLSYFTLKESQNARTDNSISRSYELEKLFMQTTKF